MSKKTSPKASKNTAKKLAKSAPITDLKPEHQRFAERVAAGENPSRVYSELYPKTSMAAARSSASRLLKNANILAEIEDRKKVFAKQANVEGSEVIGAFAVVAFANKQGAFDEEGRFDYRRAVETGAIELIKSISRTKTKYGENVRVEFYDRLHALDRLSELLGLKQKAQEGERNTLEKVVTAFNDFLKDNPDVDEEEKRLWLFRFARGGGVEPKELAHRLSIELPVQQIGGEQ